MYPIPVLVNVMLVIAPEASTFPYPSAVCPSGASIVTLGADRYPPPS